MLSKQFGENVILCEFDNYIVRSSFTLSGTEQNPLSLNGARICGSRKGREQCLHDAFLKRNKNKIIRVYLVELIKQLQLPIHHEVISNDSIKNSSFV
jgi:predicted oxidoreductase